MGQLQDRWNSMLNMVSWSAARTGHPLAQIINDRRYNTKFAPIAAEVEKSAESMERTGANIDEMEKRGMSPDFSTEHASYFGKQKDMEEKYDKLKNELRYPHSISKQEDIRDYLSDFDRARDNLAYKIIRGQARQKYGASSETAQRPMTDEEALENAYRTIARKEMATQNRRNMEEYIRFFHNPDMR